MPTLYDECLVISISDLKRLGYLRSGQWKMGSINWNRNGERFASISISVNLSETSGEVEFDYKSNGKPVKYTIELVTAPSNLNNGLVWFFICPHTGKRCRKLHLVDTYFFHRSAWRGCYYEKQIQSKAWRELEKSLLGRSFKAEIIFDTIYKKSFKRRYKGKFTKRFAHLLKQLKRIDEVS
jgi:hypothetical protein